MFPHTHSISEYGHPLLQIPAPPTMPLPMDRSRWKPNNIELAPNCPRCASSNTKFCYYNNYSWSQPRYFCKGCRRYWTKGGSLRNVPVGGGCRKNRRAKSSSARRRQSERASSINYTGTRSGNSSSEDKLCGETNASDIDMAVVFAKFLNQNLSSSQEFDNNEGNGSSSTSNLSNSLTPESVETENEAVLESRGPSDPIMDSDDQVLRGLVPQEETIFVGEELGGIELEGWLGGDEVVPDVFWSDATTSSLVTWQQPPMMQLQELEYSMPLEEDGQLPVSTENLISDAWINTWSSFDLSTLEVFSSRP